MEHFLVLGFLVGMAHALEADHLAAVGAMAAKESGAPRRLALRGAVWGLGHTITLFAICLLVIGFGLVMTEAASAALEFGVGVMLVLLGVDVIYRMRKKRIHFHAHDHGDGRPHLHAHSHEGAEVAHSEDRHEHAHPQGFPMRALLVGLVHGAAGSGGLIALAVAATQDAATALAYAALFGIGSIAGMAALSAVAAWPLNWAERSAKWLYRGAMAAAAGLAIVIGGGVMWETAPIAMELF